MVSKLAKRTPSKSFNNHKSHLSNHHRRKSPIKNPTTTSSLVASISKSIHTCHRRLIKIFTKLARFATPTKKTPRKKGFQILAKTPSTPPRASVKRSLFDDKNSFHLLPVTDKKTIFLDLDETLVHSTARVPPERYDFVVRPVIGGEKVEFYVLVRPYVDEFLKFLSERFEIVVFTAAIKEYASLVLERLDWRKEISRRLYRDSCKAIDGKYVKDLFDLGMDMRKVLIVDDNPNCYQLQPENAVPIKPFVDDLGDEELNKLMKFFERCELIDDLREAVRDYLADVK